MAFDIKKINTAGKSEEGYEFELKLPDGNGTGAYITVRGEYSATVRNHLKKKINEYQVKAKVAERKKQAVEEPTLDEIEDEIREKAIVRIVTWRGFTEGKTEVPFSVEAANELLKNNPWIQEQIMEESSNLSNFLGK